MSNLGLLLAMEREGVRVLQTAVGDRYVLEQMRAGGYGMGGEQSGHVILSAHGTTGDGVLTGLLLAARMSTTGRSLAEPGRRHGEAAAGHGERAGRRQGPRSRRRARAGCGRAGRARAWAAPAGCCCARRAPSRWCG
nr:hypothetical protein [Angustibacter aerolatus]